MFISQLFCNPDENKKGHQWEKCSEKYGRAEQVEFWVQSRVDLRPRCKSPGDCGDLNEKCLPRASCVWTFVRCWWHCLGVLWNLDEVVLLEEVHPSGQALRL